MQMLELLTELFHLERVSEEERNTTGFREEVYRTLEGKPSQA